MGNLQGLQEPLGEEPLEGPLEAKRGGPQGRCDKVRPKEKPPLGEDLTAWEVVPLEGEENPEVSVVVALASHAFGNLR